jgi:lambda repressor-like predicted transcriptional regulator
MAGLEGATEPGLDIGAILDKALQAETPKGRPPTKTQQIREQRVKIAALRKKGYTLVDIAAMVGASKDTLRQALRTTKKTKKKMAARAAQPSASRTTRDETTAKTAAKVVPAKPNVVPLGRKRKFPSNDDL